MVRSTRRFVVLPILIWLLLGAVSTGAKEPAPQKPNIVYILADDLGYAELGCYGQKRIRTPHLDRLAAEGMRFREHYAGAPVCAPSRCGRLDKDVGRILALLDELGLARDTLVIFSSDNGTTHLEREVDHDFFESVGPLRGLKGTVYEGGIRVPMIARWPGKVPAGAVTDHVSTFHDVLPTLAEVAGVEPPSDIDGISFLPTLLGEPEKQKRHEFLVWEFHGYGGQQAVRLGRWKGVRRNFRREPEAPIELYDLEKDIGETTDVAAEHPDVVARIREILVREHAPSELFPSPFGAPASDGEDEQ